jgi:hypothetical protein
MNLTSVIIYKGQIMKKCGRCQQYKDTAEFCKDRSRKDGLNHRCKSCCKEIQQGKAYKDGQKKYYREHKSEYDARAAKWREENRELLNERFRTRYRKKQTEYVVNKRKENNEFRLYCNFSANLRMSLKTASNGISKNGKCWEDIVGYTLEDLVNHLESQFQEGMTWDNYGQWHVDHILPVNSFNIQELGDEEFLKCWALENLQPLWAADNIRKSDNIGEEWGNQ